MRRSREGEFGEGDRGRAGEERGRGQAGQASRAGQLEGALGAWDAFLARKPAYSEAAVREYAGLCGDLARASGGSVRSAVEALRSRHPGRAAPHLDPGMVEAARRHLSAAQAAYLMEYLSEGVPVAVRGGPPERKGVPVPPHPSAQGHEGEIWESFWADVLRGGCLIFHTEADQEALGSVEYSPLGRVPKYDSQGREKPKGRLIHDLSYGGGGSVNARTEMDAYPAVALPTLSLVAAMVLRWKRIYPGVKVKLTKRDVDAAFRRLALGAAGAELFGAALGAYTLVLLVLSFGWAASPLAYAVLQNAISALANAYRPSRPQENGVHRFTSQTYVDDGNLSEPDIGTRCQAAARHYERCMEMLLGAGAVSEEKRRQEGEWSTTATILGIVMDTEAETVNLPAAAVERARAELAKPMWARGCTHYTLHEVQKLVGRLFRVTEVRRVARPHLQALLRMLAVYSVAGARARLRPVAKGQTQPGRRAPRWLYEALWDDLEWFRQALAREGGWREGLRSPLQATLEPEVRAADAVERGRLIFVGTDATMWSFCCVNFETGAVIRVLLTPEQRRVVREHAEGRTGGARAARVRDSVYIGIIELVAVAYAALQWGHGWEGRLAVTVTDSTNALGWLRKGYCRNAFGAHVMRVMSGAAMRGGFDQWTEWVSSEDNTLPDCGCRRWREDGTVDPGEEARWERLVAAYEGPALHEEELRVELRDDVGWFCPANGDPAELRLPGESQARSADGEAAPFVASPGACAGLRAGGRTWARRPMDGGEDVDRQAARYDLDLSLARAALFRAALAKATTDKYERDWRHWELFCQDRGREPYLLGLNRQGEIMLLVDYVADMGVLLGRAAGTVEGKLSAVRWAHVQAGLPNPLANAPALRAAMRGLARRNGPPKRKMPVTVEALVEVRRHMDPGRTEHCLLWTAILTAFLFMLRRREYLADGAGVVDYEQVLLLEDITFRRAGVEHPLHAGGEPDEVVLRLRKSKTDPDGKGAYRNHYRNEQEGFCVVRALWRHCREALARGAQPGQAAFCKPSGRVMRGTEVAVVLKAAAVQLGMPEAAMSTHSLRHGGATAMYHAGIEESEIKWLGRWLSDAWMRYVHRTHTRSRGLATRMTAEPTDLLGRPGQDAH